MLKYGMVTNVVTDPICRIQDWRNTTSRPIRKKQKHKPDEEKYYLKSSKYRNILKREMKSNVFKREPCLSMCNKRCKDSVWLLFSVRNIECLMYFLKKQIAVPCPLHTYKCSIYLYKLNKYFRGRKNVHNSIQKNFTTEK